MMVLMRTTAASRPSVARELRLVLRRFQQKSMRRTAVTMRSHGGVCAHRRGRSDVELSYIPAVTATKRFCDVRRAPLCASSRVAPTLAGNGFTLSETDNEDTAEIDAHRPRHVVGDALCGAGVQERDGFTSLSEEAFIKYFANGVAHDKAEVLYAEQEPTAASLFGARTTAAAWRSKPSWYAVSKLDQTISPDLERFLAGRMKATTVELDAGHLSLVSHAQEVADLILAAAGRNK